MTGLADFGFTPLLWRTLDLQGYLEKQNYPLSSNLVVWCAKIGLKTKKVQKISEMTRKTSKNDGFLTLFWSFLVSDPILANKLPNSNLVDNFASLNAPEDPGGVKVVELFAFEKYFSCSLDVGATWWKKLFSSNWSLMSLLLIYMHKKWYYHFA